MDEYLEKRLSHQSATTYVYVFDHKPATSFTDFLGKADESFGVCHGDELPMLFPINKCVFPGGKYSERDLIMKKNMVKMWVNFATYGNPTPLESFSKWKPLTQYPWNYVRIGSQDKDDWYIISNESDFARDRMEFWKKINLIITNGE